MVAQSTAPKRSKASLVVELVASGLLFLISASAFASPAAAVGPESPAVQQTCRVALGLSPADTAFQVCAFSLADSLNQNSGASTIGYTIAGHAAQPSQRQLGENAACERIGITPSDAGYARCVANLDAALVRADMMAN